MLHVVVLGSAAGGGVPQWNCGCPNCAAARANADLRRGQASLAVSADGANWFVINASPDLRQQINAIPSLHPRDGRLRDSPIAGVILTNGEVDAITGLLSLREGSPFAIYAHQRVLSVLKANSIFNVLNERRVRRKSIDIDQAFEPELSDGSRSGLQVFPFALPGKPAMYLERESRPSDDDGAGDTLGLRIEEKETGKHFYVVAASARVTPDLSARLSGAPLVFFDGTLWHDDELIDAGLGEKTGQRMGHISMSGKQGAVAALAGLGIGRKIFLHINNSNPVLLNGSAERQAAERAGWEIPADGLEIRL